MATINTSHNILHISHTINCYTLSQHQTITVSQHHSKKALLLESDEMFHSWLQIYLVDIQISGSVVHLMVGPISLLNIYDIGEHGFNSCLCLPLPASLLEWRNKFSVLQAI